MARISGALPNIINGISQQPAALRLPTQAESQVNCYSTVVKGLQKRPPTSYIARLMNTVPSLSKVHVINRDLNEQYVAIIKENALLEVFDINGVAQTVTADLASYTSLSAVSSVVAGTSSVVWPDAAGAISFNATITGTATVILESSLSGTFSDAVTQATRTTTGTTNLTSMPRGHAYRCRVTSYTSGTVTSWFTWEYFNYIYSPTPEEHLKATTVADYTFIVNTQTTTARGPTKSTIRNPEAIFEVKAGDYGKNYQCSIGSQSFTYQTPDGSVAAHVYSVDTYYIASILYTLMTTGTASPSYGTATASAGALSGAYTVGLHASSLLVRRTDGGDFGAASLDGRGGQQLQHIKGVTQRFSDLPYYGFLDFEIEISGDESAVADNYYVVCDNQYEGVWLETVKQNVDIEFDVATMPFALVSLGLGAFDLQFVNWGDRLVGDEETVQFPTFIDKAINDVFFFKNRLGLLAGESVCMSGTGDFFRFFKKTATALLDDDPIDLASSHNKVSILKHALPYNESLLLFSDQTQFRMDGGDILTPQTATIIQTTEFESSPYVAPVGQGTFVYFVVEKGGYSAIREYYVKENSDDTDARDVTEHVPEYIPANLRMLEASPNEDVIVAHSTSQPKRLYIYKYYWRGSEKLQSSWSYWELPDVTRIMGYGFIQSKLYIVVGRADGVFLETIDFEQGVTGDDALGYRIHVDRKIKLSHAAVSAAYNPTTEKTTFTFSTITWKSVPKVIISSGGLENPGWDVPIDGLPATYDSNTIVVAGDLTAENVIFGISYTASYEFGTLHIRKDAPGGGVTVLSDGRLQIQNGQLQFADTAYFRVTVTPKGRPTYTYHFNGALIEESTTITGALSLGTGAFKFPIRTRNDRATITIHNDSPWPMNLISFEWTGMYTPKARRVA